MAVWFAAPKRFDDRQIMANVGYLTSDLMFSSRVAVLAKQIGVSLFVVGSREKARELLGSNSAQAIIVDLEHRDADPAEIAKLVAGFEPRPMVIAYGPHVKEPLLAAARDQGLELVLSRGQFDQQIGQILKTLSS